MHYHGAKWWKFDLHTHTPISIDYGKGPNQAILRNRTPREWLLDHMAKEIDCVAVTDHNSGEWIDTLKEEIRIMCEAGTEGFRELTIFPGVEITVHGNIHLLAIFDPVESSTRISNLLGRCQYSGTLGDSDDCTNISFNDVVDVIHQMKGLAIPAHVDNQRGLFVEQDGISLRKCLAADGLLAIQLCNQAYIKPQQYIDMKLNLTELAGSDSHHPDHVGSSYTWVKMEVPNIEALRLALHDGEDGIIRSDASTLNPNDVQKRFYIQSVEIINGAKAGRGNPLDVKFSPWLNTIIGGRGSGKSSIIEYMRLPLSRTQGLPGKIGDDFKEFNQIPKERGKTGMLTNSTKIRIEMQKDGRTVALTWQDNKVIEEEKNDDGVWQKQEESSNIDSRFPIRIFSQKHLYSLTEDPNHILNIIDEQFNKTTWLEKKDDLLKAWMQSRAKQRDLSQKINSKGNLKTELDDTSAKMRIFEESGHKVLLEEYQKAQTFNNKLNNELKKIDEFHQSLQSVVSVAPTNIFSTEDFSIIDLDPESLSQLKTQNLQFENINQLMVELLSKVYEFKIHTRQLVEQIPWQTQRLIHEQNYGEFVQRLEASGEKNPDAYSHLAAKYREFEQKLSDITSLETQLEQQREESNKIFEEIELHEKHLRVYREEIIKQWQGTNPSIRMHLKVMGNIDHAESSFRSIIRKSGKEFSKDLLERDEDNNPQNGLLFELMETGLPWDKRKELIKNIQGADESDSKSFGKPFVRHMMALKSSTPEDMDRMIVWYPEDKISLKLVTTSKNEEDIETGSAGQRTAAMLSLMLLLDDSPIIIDQPEEDLDTKRITDLVVTGLRSFKTKQQIIVITHNPNIPVNGAAENIIQMNFAGGQIQNHISGALQQNEVREAVCEVMEGGKEALNKRYFRISKALEK